MDAFYLFCVLGPTIQQIFHLGIIPQEDDFTELSEQERKNYFIHNPPTEEKLFRMNLTISDESLKGMVICLTESEKSTVMKAVEFINGYAKEKDFANNDEMLHYVASKLPAVFSKGTQYEQAK